MLMAYRCFCVGCWLLIVIEGWTSCRLPPALHGGGRRQEGVDRGDGAAGELMHTSKCGDEITYRKGNADRMKEGLNETTGETARGERTLTDACLDRAPSQNELNRLYAARDPPLLSFVGAIDCGDFGPDRFELNLPLTVSIRLPF
mmetsp:Transcript_22909/g.59809  ORF Transcript_22909/g.59809 Transcript_22909/m.59809 type:complete len:145 (+) Transcript_22909:119-553(+)